MLQIKTHISNYTAKIQRVCVCDFNGISPNSSIALNFDLHKKKLIVKMTWTPKPTKARQKNLVCWLFRRSAIWACVGVCLCARAYMCVYWTVCTVYSVHRCSHICGVSCAKQHSSLIWNNEIYHISLHTRTHTATNQYHLAIQAFTHTSAHTHTHTQTHPSKIEAKSNMRRTDSQ